MTITHLTNPY